MVAAICGHSRPRPAFLYSSRAMELQAVIEDAYERCTTPGWEPDAVTRDAVAEVLTGLDAGRLRVAEPGEWTVHEWLKKAVLLCFRLQQNRHIAGGFTDYYDKVALKFSACDAARFQELGVRVVPPALARHGSYIGPGAVLMPCYVNIGAYVGARTMIDTWATVGSCAQIGAGVHLSGGVGIGGVLEPLQARPTIIEDGCFIGARSEIVEGVIVGAGAVISMGVYIGASTRIYDRQTGEVSYGRIPPGAVVVPGALPAADNSHSLYCAVIVKRVDAATRAKVGINQLLREGQSSV